MRKRKASLPSRDKIREFWWPTLRNLGKLDESTTKNDCFCCGLERFLERAHIYPEFKGGSNTVDNLHLLCRSCHIESEGFTGEVYWDWFKSKDIYVEADRKMISDMNFYKSVLLRLKKEKPEISWDTLSSVETANIIVGEMYKNE